MGKNILFETNREREVREREERVVSFYLRHVYKVLNGEITPNRLIQKIADDENITRYGVTVLLKRKGIYKNAHQPVLQANPSSAVQLSLAL